MKYRSLSSGAKGFSSLCELPCIVRGGSRTLTRGVLFINFPWNTPTFNQTTPIFLLFNEQKGGSFEPKEPPLDPPLIVCIFQNFLFTEIPSHVTPSIYILSHPSFILNIIIILWCFTTQESYSYLSSRSTASQICRKSNHLINLSMEIGHTGIGVKKTIP